MPPLKKPNTRFWSLMKDGQTVGKVTSAVYSPRLEQNIALAMVATELSEIGTTLEIPTESGSVTATVVEKPFFDPKKQRAIAS